MASAEFEIARSSPPAPDAGSGRAAWADAVKGLCIVLVVLWHVVWKHYLHVDWMLPQAVPAAWSVFGRMLLPMRMPLFFTVSGMFAAGAVTRPWPVVARTRVARFGYLYVLWLLIHTAVLAPLPVPFDTEIARTGRDLVEELTVTPTTLWYLLALAAYTVIAKLARPVPAAVVLGAAFVLATVSAAGWLDSPGNRAGLYQNLVFFLGGLYLRAPVARLAERASWRRLLLTGCLFAAVLAVLGLFDAMRVPGLWPIAGTVATVFGITAISVLSRWRPLGTALAALGQRTLPIYIMHLPVLAVAHWLLVDLLARGPAPLRSTLGAVEPVLLTAALIAFTLALHTMLRRAGAGWLFDLPGGTRSRDAGVVVATGPGLVAVQDDQVALGDHADEPHVLPRAVDSHPPDVVGRAPRPAGTTGSTR